MAKYRTDSYPYKVYTALVTQSDSNSADGISSGLLTIGRTYRINENSPGMNFLNVGAIDNTVGTYFVATGQIPNSWGTGAVNTLTYSVGAPVVIVLENTIGDIFWTYSEEGIYRANLKEGFPLTRTYCPGVVIMNEGNDGTKAIALNPDPTTGDYVQITTFNANGLLNNTPIEIRVYQ